MNKFDKPYKNNLIFKLIFKFSLLLIFSTFFFNIFPQTLHNKMYWIGIKYIRENGKKVEQL